MANGAATSRLQEAFGVFRLEERGELVSLLLGWLSLFGYRITSERGHHSVAVRAVRAILDSHEDTAQAPPPSFQ